MGEGHKLIIGEAHALWDEQPILTGFPSTFTDPAGLCSITYNDQGTLLQPGREGKSLHVLHITLPKQVSIQVNRWDEPGEGRYINVKITMPKQPLQDGDCGNFDGIPTNDQRLQVRARVGKDGIPAQDLILQGGKTAVDMGIELCSDETLTRAHEECKASSGKF